MGLGIGWMVMSYVLSLVSVFVLALIVDALAPTFAGQKDRIQATKTAAYSYTAYWVASIGTLVPWLGFLILIAGGMYSIYLLYLGLPHTMKSPPDKAAGYTAVTVVVAIVLGWVIALVSGAIMGRAVLGGLASSSAMSLPRAVSTRTAPMGKLESLEQARWRRPARRWKPRRNPATARRRVRRSAR